MIQQFYTLLSVFHDKYTLNPLYFFYPSPLLSLLFLIFFSMYLFWQRQREWGRGKERGRQQNPKQAPGSELSAQSPTRGSNPQDREIMTWAEVRCLTNWAPRGLLMKHRLKSKFLVVKLTFHRGGAYLPRVALETVRSSLKFLAPHLCPHQSWLFRYSLQITCNLR